MRTLLAATLGIAFTAALASGVVAAERRDEKPRESMSDKLERLSDKTTRVDREADPVKAAQRALNARGYDVGEPDGRMGPKTRAAVQKFQKDESLEVTGRLDPPTLARLRSGKADDRPSASPRTDGERVKPGPGASTTTPDAELGRDAKGTKR